MSRKTVSALPDPAPSIARALHRRLPDRIRGAGTLFLWLRPGRAALRVAQSLRRARREHEFIDGCVRIPLRESAVQSCTAELCEGLSEAETLETRALFMPGVVAPRLPDFAHMTTLHSLDVLARSGWLLDQLAEGRFTSFFHPIVHANDTSCVYAHEDPVKGLIAEKLLEIGRGLGIATIVEGIEQEAELSWVRDHGGEFVQGFLLGKPAPAVRS